jgi:hypothetical protein
MTNEKLNPEALAQLDDNDDRDGVQEVTPAMITAYAMEAHGLPDVSARPFGDWLDENWFDWADDTHPPMTNGALISGAVAHWTGKA